ncbi:hypothetical protein ScPMuIL_013281 [Solemya velum]
MAKKTQPQVSVKPDKADEATPVSSRSQSPATIPPIAQKAIKRTPYIPNQLPVHRPVIINLNEDSSSEEEEEEGATQQKQSTSLLGGLDSFLKEARKAVEEQEKGKVSTEARKSDKQQQQEKVRGYENEYINKRKAIIKDTAIFKSLLMKASNYVQNLRVSEEKVEKLKENLAVAEKIRTACKSQVEKAKSQARLIKVRLIKKKLQYEEIEKMLMETGSLVYGKDYSPKNIPEVVQDGMGRKVTAESQANKRKLDMLSVTVTNETAVKKKHIAPGQRDHSPRPSNSNQNKKVKSSEIIAREKEKLQKLAEEYGEKIRLLKQAQAKKEKENLAGAASKSNELSKNSNKGIPRFEKIEIDTTDFDSDGGRTLEKHTRRRQSLIELNPSTKPNIMNNIDKKNSSQEPIPPNVPPTYSLPNEEKINALMKLQNDKVEKVIRSRHWSSMTSNIPFEFTSLVPEIQEIPKLNLDSTVTSKANKSRLSDVTPLAYRSALLNFRSYRFSPYYRTKGNLTLSSRSFSHKINPKKIMCRFDLQGTCHDENCSGQHQDHYVLSEKELLQDIVSYCPSLGGVTDESPITAYSDIIGKYVDNFMKHNSVHLTPDQLSLLLVSRVSEKSGLVRPHSVFLNDRRWKPSQAETKSSCSILNIQQLKKKNKSDSLQTNPQCDHDSVIGDQDVRYFLSDSTVIGDMEAAVMATPEDVQLWLKLAYKKLNDYQNSPEVCLDHALNVLARAIERNKTSSQLWQHYLTVYTQHKDSSDLLDLCQTALQYAPSYQIWWQLMSLTMPFTEKVARCSELTEFVVMQDNVAPELVSHQLLETMLYKVFLYIQSGRYNSGLRFLLGVLKPETSKKKSLLPYIICKDLCTLWLCYIHLLEFHQLPSNIYDPANQQSGKVVSKDRILIPWYIRKQLRTPINVIVSLFWDAIKFCIGSLETSTEITDIMDLLQNFIHLFRSQCRFEEAVSLCRKVLMNHSSIVDIWLAVADIYGSSGEHTATKQVFEDGLEANPQSMRLYYHAASYQFSIGKPEDAIEYLKQGAMSFFDIPNDDPRTENTSALYCCLLRQTLPIQYDIPAYRDENCESLVQQEQSNIWLAYRQVLLLELQGDHNQVTECYETALGSSDSILDIYDVWLNYILYYLRVVTASPNIVVLSRRLYGLVRRCLTSIPTKFVIPMCQGRYWIDYRFVNRVIEIYMKTVPADRKLSVLGTFVNIFPSNTDLVLRACEMAMLEGDTKHARKLCSSTVYDGIGNAGLWKLVISMALKDGEMKEVQKLFCRAVQVLPYNATLWKDFLLFEVTQKSMESVDSLVKRCQQLNVIIDDCLAHISKG